MHETELPLRVLPSQLAIAAKRSGAVRADLQHRDPIEDASVRLGVGLQRLDHQPVVGMGRTDIRPAHVLEG